MGLDNKYKTMAIRVMKRGIIECDKCGKEVAKIKASSQTFTVLESEPFTQVFCLDCYTPEE